MKDKLRSLLALSSAERKGVLALVIIILLMTCIQAYLAFRQPSDIGRNKNLIVEEPGYFEQSIKVQSDSSSGELQTTPLSDVQPADLFFFDPNTVSVWDLKRLGMNQKLMKTFMNYRLHGGKFYEPSDLNKIYGMSPVFYNRVLPYIKITKTVSAVYHSGLTHNSGPPADLNLADSAALLKIYGIGPVLSSRIIRYRTLLGGFYDKKQLKEVYGMQDSLITIMDPLFYADTARLVRLNLNLASEYELARHPYIGKFAAKGIIRYRSKVQKINSVDELKTNGLIPAEQFEKLKKYLTI